jgi:hypothetical protein
MSTPLLTRSVTASFNSPQPTITTTQPPAPRKLPFCARKLFMTSDELEEILNPENDTWQLEEGWLKQTENTGYVTPAAMSPLKCPPPVRKAVWDGWYTKM